MKTEPKDSELTDFINNLSPAAKPTINFNEVDPADIKQPTLVYVKTMVQDIREGYYYSFIMKRPFSESKPYCLLKYGNKVENFSEELLESPEYIKVMTDR